MIITYRENLILLLFGYILLGISLFIADWIRDLMCIMAIMIFSFTIGAEVHEYV